MRTDETFVDPMVKRKRKDKKTTLDELKKKRDENKTTLDLLESYKRAEFPERWRKQHLTEIEVKSNYNKIFRTSNGTVLRVHRAFTDPKFYPDSLKAPRKLVRGDAILKLLRRVEGRDEKFGPLLMRLYGEGLVNIDIPFAEFPKEIRGTFGRLDHQQTFWFSEVEDLGNVTLRNTTPTTNAANIMAPLIWFFAVAGYEIGLVHHELHAGNIMMRPFSGDCKLKWSADDADNDTIYELKMTSLQFIPVVIDYDFAMTSVTSNDFRGDLHGSAGVQSPEDAFASFFDEDPELSEATDWFALGCVLMSMITKTEAWRYVFAKTEFAIKYSNHVDSKIGTLVFKSNVEDFYKPAKYLIPALCFFNAVAKRNMWYPPRHVFPTGDKYDKCYDAFFGEVARKLIEETFTWPLWTTLKRIFEQYPAETDLAFALLNWDPAARTLGGRPYRYLHFHVFDKLFLNAKTYQNDDDALITLQYDFRGGSLQKAGAVKRQLNRVREQEPNLALMSCINCQKPNLQVSCGQCESTHYCSVACAKNHWHIGKHYETCRQKK
jgi:hypothetical protein